MALADELNLGPRSAAWLRDVGFTTVEEIAAHGVVATARAVRALGHPVSFNLVVALQGAVMGCDWRQVPEEVRQGLRAAWDAAR